MGRQPSGGRPAAGGGRWVEVAPERLARWLAGFAERHGALTWTAADDVVTVVAADGARAECVVPFPPLVRAASEPVEYAGLVGHAAVDRRVGVLLVRRGGYAAGVFLGSALESSKVGSSYVQGRTAAGGWSQQRFARRREKQTDELSTAAADVAARLLIDPDPSWLATGGDRALLERVLADPRLAVLAGLPRAAHLAVGDPRADLVRSLPDLLTRIPVTVTDPA